MAEAPRVSTSAHLLTVALLVAAYATLAVAQIRSTSATIDEPLYLRLGQELYAGRGFSEFLRPMIPPLPVLLQGWTVALRYPQLPANSDAEYAAAIATARITAVATCGVPLILLIYAWVGSCYGWWAGRGAAGCAALSPFLIGNGALATTDLCFALFGFLAVIALTRYDQHPARGRWWAAAFAAGLALAAKQSSLFLLPVIGALFIRQARADGVGRARTLFRACRRAVGLSLAAFLVCWACHGFAGSPLLDANLEHPSYWKVMGRGDSAVRLRHVLEIVPIPLPLSTFLGQIAHGFRGHEAYLCGEIRFKGWWYYFPVAVAVKVTPVELMMAGLVVVALLTPGTWSDRRCGSAAIAVVVFGFLCLTSTLDLGVRYLSVLYPLGALLAVGWLARNVSPTPRVGAGILVIVVGFQSLACRAAFPDQLAYFNAFAGGPAAGHRYLADSNLDWGQGLPALQRAVSERKPKTWILAYYEYGSMGARDAVEPSAYGLTGFVSWKEATAKQLAEAEMLAVSTSLLVGLGNAPSGEFAPLQGVPPTTRAGAGFWLHDLTDPAGRAAATLAYQQRHDRK